MLSILTKRNVRIAAFLILVLIGISYPCASSADIQCDGQYGGHLQGIATDGKTAIFWSFTVELVKTDINGGRIKSITVPTHHGDLVYHDGKVYVAVNLGLFNQEPGKADSWVYIYNADDLSLIAKHEVQEVVHGAGGMTYRDGRFFVVGGLPDSYDENYVYEYGMDFVFIGRHVVQSGHTRLGIQTACYGLNSFWFGCYGYPDNCALLKTDITFKRVERLDTHTSVGIDYMGGDRFLQGFTGSDPETKKYWGRARFIRFDSSRRGRFVRAE